MTRQDLIARSRQISAASDVIGAYGTSTQRTHRAAYLARGRFADVVTMGAAILTSVPRSDYALTA
jgi:hypothetical protein